MANFKANIGRGDECEIRINDNSQRISRNHATIQVLPNGKIFIIDHSSNGTFVNGVRISSNVDFPLKRGDDVSFAHVANLDWTVIPRAKSKIMVIIIGVLVIVGILCAVFFIFKKGGDEPIPPNPNIQQEIKKDSVQQPVPVDTAAVKPEVEEPLNEQTVKKIVKKELKEEKEKEKKITKDEPINDTITDKRDTDSMPSTMLY